MTRPDCTPGASAPPDAGETQLFDELRTIYRSVDEAFAGWGCPASTDCCRFGLTGREPYVTSIELRAIERAISALGGTRALRSERRSGPCVPDRAAGKRRLLVVAGERACPLLTESGRCSIYADRPLGCRTFYCDRAIAAAPVARRVIGAFVRGIQDLAARHRSDGDRGRPLTRAIAPLLGGGRQVRPGRRR